jgi:pSer/pThr/pTyr-binding forkhead associated (FHA) protein
MFHLIDEQRQTSYPLTGLLKEIGRASECDLCLPFDGSVSRQHARLEWDGHAWVIIDTNSTNGTFVNGERITERRLSPGDQIEVGNVKLTFQLLPEIDRPTAKKITLVGQRDQLDLDKKQKTTRLFTMSKTKTISEKDKS